MAHMGRVETDDKGAEFRQRQPHRYLPPQHAPLGCAIARVFASAFAGDDERDFGAVGLGAAQEGKQRGVRLTLRHSMQIDPRLDSVAAARQTLPQSSVERCKR